jgi:hypothetical protein
MKNSNDVPDGERTFLESIAKRFALDIWHSIVEKLAVLARREQRDDMRMLQLRRNLDLAAETLAIDAGCELGRQYFYHDLSAEGSVGGDENATHARAGELALYVIRGCKRGSELIFEVAH